MAAVAAAAFLSLLALNAWPRSKSAAAALLDPRRLMQEVAPPGAIAPAVEPAAPVPAPAPAVPGGVPAPQAEALGAQLAAVAGGTDGGMAVWPAERGHSEVCLLSGVGSWPRNQTCQPLAGTLLTQPPPSSPLP